MSSHFGRLFPAALLMTLSGLPVAAGAADTTTDIDGAFIFVLLFAAAIVLFAFVASKLSRRPGHGPVTA